MSQTAYLLCQAMYVLDNADRFNADLVAQYRRAARRFAAWLIAGNSMP